MATGRIEKEGIARNVIAVCFIILGVVLMIASEWVK